ncbi:MAG: nitrous oxide-stimulated promoter family protein [Dehalococcoidales bacterium]|nr:nitrous oxide-stimulated promoter family protein [Dehalococcoidales bacterium]
MSDSKRIERESKTVITMIAMYCRKNHSITGLCSDCREMKNYALKRLESCPFGEGKTTCAKCQVHCYNPQMRQRIRKVMSYAGPRMIYTHPIQAVRHLIDGRRKIPLKREQDVK